MKYAWQELAEEMANTLDEIPDRAEASRQDCLTAWREEHPGQPDPDDTTLHGWLMTKPYQLAHIHLALMMRAYGQQNGIEEVATASLPTLIESLRAARQKPDIQALERQGRSTRH